MPVDASLRRFFAEEIRAAAGLGHDAKANRLIDAFASVPREAHVHPGPWLLRSATHFGADSRTPDANPSHLYHNVLVALDEAKGINIGDASLWARLFARAGVAEGARILQVGAGSGYFTAILAELVGPNGLVVATEIEDDLTDLAEQALATRANVRLIRGNGATDISAADGPFDLIVAFAGVTHPVAAWIDVLAPDARLLLPVTAVNWWGAMMLFQRSGDGYVAETLGRCGFFPCEGARDAVTEVLLAGLWGNHANLEGATFDVTLQDGGAVYRRRDTG